MVSAVRQGRRDRRWGRGFRALTLASVFTLPAAAQSPQGGIVVVGGATISGQGGQTLINQTSDRALIDWRSFDIGKDASVLVTQPGAGSLLVNRVTGDGIGTRIDGALSANGQVVVIDKAGIVIGRGARVDAGAFLATTADIDNADFAAGRLIFGKAGLAGAAVVNEGTIRVADGGYAVLAAPDVRNSGLVEARLGRVVLAGAERFTLDLAGDGLLRFELPADMAGRVMNDGTLTGAQVLMTARAARDGMAGVVNAGGLVEATVAREVDGRIIIGGEGTETVVTGTVRAAGGSVDILGDKVVLAGATIDAAGAVDGGSVRIGGDFQGGGDLHRAQTTRIDADSRINADGATGAGGRVIVWADGRTDYAGAISARGASDGGFAEVSGKGSLRFAGTADLAGGAGGKAGELLLDPTNITIGTVADIDGAGAQDDDIPANGTVGSGDYGSVTSLITASAINALLNNGTSVSLTASNDINVNSSIAKNSGNNNATLKLDAGRDLSFASGIGVTSSSGALSMDFDAGRSFQATGGSFTSNGGGIDIRAAGTAAATGINLSGASFTTGSGSLTLVGTGSATGVYLGGGSSLSAGNGGIAVTGTGAVGVDFAHGTVSTTSGAITVQGTSNGNGAGAVGLRLDGTSGGGISAASAAVNLTGTGGNGTGTANHGVLVMGGFGVTSGSGTLTVTATGGTGSNDLLFSGSGNFGGSSTSQGGNITLIADSMYLTGAGIRSSGTVRLRTRTASGDLIIGGADDSLGLALSTTELATVTAGVLALGHSEHTGTISVDANPGTTGIGALEISGDALVANATNGLPGLAQTFLNAGKGVMLLSAGNLTVSNNINKSGSVAATLTLRAGGNLTIDPGVDFVGTNGLFNLNFTAGYTTTGTLTGSGTSTWASNGGDITLAGQSGLTLSSTTVTSGAGTIVLAGGDIALTGSSITSTGRVVLRPFASGGQMNIGSTGSGGGVAHVSQGEINQVSAGVLRLGLADDSTASYGGNMVISSALSHASDTVELASGGSVTQTADINVANLALLGTGGSFTLTRTGNDVTTLAGNTGSVDFRSNLSLSVGTVSSTTGLTFTGNASLYAGDSLITLAQAAAYAGSGTGTLTLSSDIDVAVSANVGVSGSGKLNIVLAADGNEAGTPGSVAISNATLSTNGGNITIGSGTDPATRAAEGRVATGIGVNITGSTLNAGTGGAILVNGDGAPSGTNSTTGIGISVSGGSTLSVAGNGTITLTGNGGANNDTGIGINISGGNLTATGAGTITLNGTGGTGNALTAGVAIGGDSTISTATGAITINGAQAATGTNRFGVLFRQDTTNSALYSTGGGTITITATGTEGKIAANSSSSDYSKALIGCASTSTCYGGTITLKTDRLDLTDAGAGGDSNPSIRVGGTGALVIQSNTVSTSIGVGSGSGDLVLRQSDIDAFRDGVSSVTIGQSTGTGAITVSGATFRDNVTIQGGTGAVTIAGALSTGSGSDAGTLSVSTKGLLTVSAAISTQNQDITLSADKLNLTGSLDAGTATATLTTATAARAIDLGSATDAATALEISSAELNLVKAGIIRVGSSSAGAISVTQAIAPSQSSTLHLRSGAGITQTGSITVANLAVTATGAVALASANNAVTSFAASATNSNVALRDDTGFAIATVDGVAGAALGTGNLLLTSTGAVTQTAAITAAGLALTGTGGAYTLAHASNAVSTVAANTGSVDIGLSGAGSVGTVGSVTGITTSGTTKLTTGGNLTIASGASVSAGGTGDALVLAANGNFTNNGGSGALVLTGGGRFLVFSNAPSTSSTGGVADAKPLYNRAFTFGTRSYATVSNTGNRFVYSYAPTLTVTPNSVSRTYTGSTITGLDYTITGLVTGDVNAFTGDATITGAGRNVGAYTLTAGVGTLESDLGYGFSYGTGTLTVTKKALTYAVANGSTTYGTLAGDGAVTWTGLVDGDDLAGTVTTYRGTTAEVLAVRTDVGSLTQKVTGLTGTDAGNYEIAATGNTDGTLTIGQKALTYSVAAVDSIYGTLATLASAVLTGVVSGDDVTASVGLSGGTLAAKLAAGTYDQTVTLGGADLGNYSHASGHSVGQLTVARKQITYTISDVSSTYGTLAVLGTPVLTGVETGDTVTADVLLGSGTLTNRLSAGTHNLVLSSLAGTSSANYVLAGSGNRNGTLTIAQKALTASIASVTGTYGQAMAPGAVSLTGVVTGDSVTGDLVVEAGGSSVTVGPTLAAGSYTQRVTGLSGADASNYVLQGGPFTSSLTVTPAALTVTAANLVKVYGTDDPSLTYNVTGLVNGDSLSGALTRVAGRNVGTYAISQGSLSASANYTLSFQGGSLTINPAALTITAASVAKVYGTDDPALTYGVTGLVAGDSLSGSLTRAAGRDAGTYAISQGSLAAGSNYVVTFQGGTLTINPAPLTIRAASVTKVYGTDDPALTYGVTGLVAGDSLSGALERVSGRDVGTYVIGQGSLSAGPNYDVTFQGGSLTVTPAALTITAGSATKVYGTDDPAFSYSVTGLLAGDSLSGALERAGGRDVGTYAIGQGSLSAGANYNVSFQGGSLTITPAALTITASSVTKIYGDGDPSLTYSVSGLAAGDSLGGELARTQGENVGTYAISQGSLDAGANYTVAFQAGALTITPAALNVTADAITSLYMDRDPELTYQVSGLKRGDAAGAVLSGTLTRAAGTDVGTYAITLGGLVANANYRLNFTGAAFTILPANLTLSVVAANLTKIYGDADPTLSFTATGLRGRDTLEAVLTGSLSRVAGEDVGTYAITQGSLASTSANYIIAFTPGTLTITPANLSVAAMMVTRTYGDGDPTLTYSVSGLKRGDTAGSVLSGGLVRAGGEDAGTYAIGQGSLALNSGNYTMSFTGGQLTINPALLSVTANAVSRLYGAADPALTYAVAGLKRGDSAGAVLSGALARDAGGNAGRYAIGQGTLAANGNYRISFQGADLTITPAPLSVLVDSVTRAYGAANPVFTARYQGLVNGDTGDSLTGLRFQTLADATAAAGPYAINADGITNGNYQITYVSGLLTVTGGGVLPPAVAEAAPVTTITQPARAPTVPAVTVAAPVVVAPTAPAPAPASSTPAPTVDGASAALAAVNQNVQSASGSAADDDSAAEEMIPGLLSQQRRLPGEAPEGTPGLEQQFPNLGRVW